MSVRAGVVLPAGGSGRRMGGVRKPFLELAGRAVLLHTLEPFLKCEQIAQVVIALPSDMIAEPPSWLATLDPRITLVAGGAERGDSVRSALDSLHGDIEVILVHDAARPLVTGEIIDRCIAAAAAGRCVIAAVPVTDTIKTIDAAGLITDTPDRSALRAAQTPQAFPAHVIRDAYARAHADHIDATDDAAVAALYGAEVFVVDGAADNIKITSPADLVIAEALLLQRRPDKATQHERADRMTADPA